MITREKLSGAELDQHIARLPEWRASGDQRLNKTFLFPDFKDALDFVNRVGELAEQLGHYPDLHLAWGRVDVETSTHDAGGLTESDFTLAEGIDRIFLERRG